MTRIGRSDERSPDSRLSALASVYCSPSHRLHLRRAGLLYGLVLLLAGGLLWGCQEGSGAVDVPAGRYEATIEGAVTDTLRGVVHTRVREDTLLGIELGAQDQPGLSIEVEPMSPGPRTYRILDEKLLSLNRGEAEAGGMAFLSLNDVRFRATAGSLSVEHVDGPTVAATFSFEMDARIGRGGTEAAVLVTGRLYATPDRE